MALSQTDMQKGQQEYVIKPILEWKLMLSLALV